MQSQPLRIAVLGAGAWGTALAIAFAPRHQVKLWAREAELSAALNRDRVNRQFLPDCPLPDSLAVSDDFEAVVADAELVLVATPIVGLRPSLERLARARGDVPVLWACKGFEAGSGLLPHQVAAEACPGFARVGALSGPSFAREVALGLPSAVTLAASDAAFAADFAARLHSPLLRIYAHDDLTGVEVGGAVKNVMAIATGVCDGLGLGMNSRAALITRGLAEITRLAVALGAREQSMLGLAGIGDLILTCTGALSRNRQVGLKLAEGKPLQTILDELGHVAEGVPTAREVRALSRKLGVEMPITEAVCALLYDGEAAGDVVGRLLERSPKLEFPD